MLINDGTGHFTNESAARIPGASHDHESVAAADFDGDGFVDLVVVSEDDRVHELFLNDGTGVFTEASDRLAAETVANGVVAEDINGDGHPDIVIANNGQDTILINDGTGMFSDETADRLPRLNDVSQDLAFGDIDGDGDRDLIFANEGPDRLLLNDGAGVFTDVRGAFTVPDESRKVTIGDVDGDGDLDVFFANVATFMPDADPRDRLWINTDGQFVDASDRMPADSESNFHGALVDIDSDDDLDIIAANTTTLIRPGDAPLRVYTNDGMGNFADTTTDILPPTARGNGFDVEVADFDGDGKADLYLALRFGADRLLLRR
jgi:hypothetical protein